MKKVMKSIDRKLETKMGMDEGSKKKMVKTGVAVKKGKKATFTGPKK